MKYGARRLGLLLGLVLVLMLAAGYVFHRSLESPADVIFSLVTFPHTIYATQYSDDGFRRVTPNMTINEVERILGEPLSQTWLYNGCPVVWVGDDQAESFTYDVCPWPPGPRPVSAAALLKLRGEPQQVIWHYSKSPDQSSFHERRIYFHQKRVEKKEAKLYVD